MSGANTRKRPLNNLSFFELFSSTINASMIDKFYFYFFLIATQGAYTPYDKQIGNLKRRNWSLDPV